MEYSGEGSAACLLCEANSYNALVGNAGCELCPSNRLSDPGSISLDSCVDAVPNFAISAAFLILLIFIAINYMYRGGFHAAAFERKLRALTKLCERCRELNMKVTLLRWIYPRETKTKKRRGPFITFLFLVLSTAIIFVIIVLFLVLVLSRMLFNAVIIWKGFDYNSMGLNKLHERFEAVREILRSWKTFFWLVGQALTPIIFILDYFASFKIDFGAVEVTCKGFQAPIEIFVNCMVLGFIVVVIESEFHIIQNSLFKGVFKKSYKMLLSSKLKTLNVFVLIIVLLFVLVIAIGVAGFISTFASLDLGMIIGLIIGAAVGIFLMKRRFWLLALFALAVSVITGLNPLLGSMQFLMSIIFIDEFFEKNSMFHTNTESCDKAIVVYGIGMDTLLAYLSTFLFWLLLFPAIYTASRVAVPYGTDSIWKKYKDSRILEFITERIIFDSNGFINKMELDTDFQNWYQDTYGCEKISAREVHEYLEMDERFGKCKVNEGGWTGARIRSPRASRQDSTSIQKSCWLYMANFVGLARFFSPDLWIVQVEVWTLSFFYSALGIEVVNPYTSIEKHPARELKKSQYSAIDLLKHYSRSELLDAGYAQKELNDINQCSESEESSKNTCCSLIFSFGDLRDNEKEDWLKQQRRALPTYRDLCRMIQISVEKRVCNAWNIPYNEKGFIRRCISFMIIIFSYFIPLLHLFSEEGWVHWFLVFEKYFILLLVCIGVWTNQCIEGYGLDESESIYESLKDIPYIWDDENDPLYHRRGLYEKGQIVVNKFGRKSLTLPWSGARLCRKMFIDFWYGLF